MARGTQHRKRRPPADARVAPAPAPKRGKPKHDTWEDQLFFSRLRNHAKWMFALLALVFGLGFVLFGVGTGSGGLGDVFPELFSRSSGPSVSSLQDKLENQPKNAQAWYDLATALQQDDDRLDEAIVAMSRYTELKPKDETGLQALAGLYLRSADQHANVYIVAQARSQSLAPRDPFTPPATSPLGSIFTDPLSTAVTELSQGELDSAYAQFSDAQSKAVDMYERIVALRPDDATNQYRLASLAKDSGQSEVAIKAYTKFLSLSPNDSLAPAAREALAQLTASPAATVSGG